MDLSVTLSKRMNTCPFCSSKKVKITGREGKYQGLCNVCYARGPITKHPIEAFRTWNIRGFGKIIQSDHIVESSLTSLCNEKIALEIQTPKELETLKKDLELLEYKEKETSTLSSKLAVKNLYCKAYKDGTYEILESKPDLQVNKIIIK